MDLKIRKSELTKTLSIGAGMQGEIGKIALF